MKKHLPTIFIVACIYVACLIAFSISKSTTIFSDDPQAAINSPFIQAALVTAGTILLIMWGDRKGKANEAKREVVEKTALLNEAYKKQEKDYELIKELMDANFDLRRKLDAAQSELRNKSNQ